MNDSVPRFGRPMERREDPALLTGRAEYTDDLTAPGMTHAAIVRSPYGHARIESIDAAAAEAMSGVVAVFTAADLDASDAPGIIGVRPGVMDVEVPGHPILAADRVRYQGDPVAVVVAEDRYVARDAAEVVEVSYDRLDAVVDPAEAVADGAPTIHGAAPDNVAVDHERGDRAATDAAFHAADSVVELDLRNNRLIPSAIEPRAALARYDAADGRLTVEMTSQAPFRHRAALSDTLGVPEHKLRVIAPDVGGGFGHKGHHHPGDALAGWCAMQVERPVKWVATRAENYLAGAHSRDHVTHAELALESDGTITGLRVDTFAGLGAYPLGGSPAIVTGWGRLLSSQYAIPAIHCRTRGTFTTTAPVHTYRGGSRPMAIYVTERIVDAAARELGLDPAELRRRNQIPADAFPYETATGSVYDSGDYATGLEKALDAVDYDALRERRAGAREEGRYLGIGIACFVESTGNGFESGLVRVHPSGTVSAHTGTHSHGQGHETSYAQVLADELGIAYDDIEVVQGDTERVPVGTGTFGSRSAVTGGSALAESARKVVDKGRRIAAHLLETSAEDVGFEDGTFSVRGAPERSVGFDDVAAAAYGGDLPADLERGLEATTFFDAGDSAYAFGTHVAVVEVDPATGALTFDRYLALDDCGPRINPTIVEGQVHGSVAQGIGQARYEHGIYDDNGQLLTGSLQDYTVPKAVHVPRIDTEETVTPSPRNPLGVKGVGEAGTIAAPPAVVNAVVDALAPLGVDHVDMPLTDETVWQAIRDAGGG